MCKLCMLTLLTIVAGMLLSCESDHLKELEQIVVHDYARTSVNVNFCTIDPRNVEQRLKILFMLDKSGSNQSRGKDVDEPKDGDLDVSGFPGTDPLGTRRYEPIIRYLRSKQLEADDSIYFGLMNFSGTVSGNFAVPSAVDTSFTNDISAFDDLVRSHYFNLNNDVTYEMDVDSDPLTASEQIFNGLTPVGTGDGGGTNYTSAIAGVRGIILSDIEQAKQNSINRKIITSHYYIFYLTDGAPWVDGELQTPDAIERGLESLTSLLDDDPEWIGSIKIAPLYYYSDFCNTLSVTDIYVRDNSGNIVSIPAGTVTAEEREEYCHGLDMNAIDRLARMATKTGGAFKIPESESDAIDFESYEFPNRLIKNELKDIIVLNLGLNWNRGVPVRDSDGDGLPDYLEPDVTIDGVPSTNTRDVDGDGLSDLVEYRISGESSITSVTTGGCAGNYDTSSDMDLDFLNDCEEYLLEDVASMGTNYLKFDSNYDWISDELALRSGITIGADQEREAFSDLDSDNQSNYKEIKYNTPLNFDNNDIYALEMQQYRVSVVSSTTYQTCYEVNVTNLIELGEENFIRVYILEKASATINRGFIRVAEKSVRSGNVAVFTDNDFPNVN